MGLAGPISPEELRLIGRLAVFAAEPVDISNLEQASTIPMDDGGMGSFAINPTQPRSKGLTAVAWADATDADGVPLSICLFVDADRRPREFDVWKVDFTPLVRMPEASSLRQAERRATRR